MTPTIPNRPAPIVWALRNCAFTELRRLDAIETDGEVVITGAEFPAVAITIVNCACPPPLPDWSAFTVSPLRTPVASIAVGMWT